MKDRKTREPAASAPLAQLGFDIRPKVVDGQIVLELAPNIEHTVQLPVPLREETPEPKRKPEKKVGVDY